LTVEADRSCLDGNVGVLDSVENVDGKLNGFGFLLGIGLWSEKVVLARVIARVDADAPVVVEISLDIDTNAVRSGVYATVFHPAAILMKIQSCFRT
jgi:hypothetical protein